MYYPKATDKRTNSNFTPSKYLYTANNVIYKISNISDTGCNGTNHTVVAVNDELCNDTNNCIKITYKNPNGTDEVIKYVYLDYLITDGDSVNGKTIKPLDCPSDGNTSTATNLCKRFKNMAMQDFVTEIVNGRQIDTVFNSLPDYLRFKIGEMEANDAPDPIHTIVTKVEPVNDMNLNDMYIDIDTTNTESPLYKAIMSKAEEDAKVAANKVFKAINHKVKKIELESERI